MKLDKTDNRIEISQKEISHFKWYTRCGHIRAFRTHNNNPHTAIWTEEIYLLWQRGNKQMPDHDGWIYFSIGKKNYKTQLSK